MKKRRSDELFYIKLTFFNASQRWDDVPTIFHGGRNFLGTKCPIVECTTLMTGSRGTRWCPGGTASWGVAFVCSGPWSALDPRGPGSARWSLWWRGSGVPGGADPRGAPPSTDDSAPPTPWSSSRGDPGLACGGTCGSPLIGAGTKVEIQVESCKAALC